jgi:hypothetical protein
MKQSTARSTRREKRAKTSPPKLDGLMRQMNARQAHQGVARLQADLKALRELGIVDEQGNPVHQDFPSQLLEEASDVV